MSNMKLGSELTPEQQREALNRFIYRYTGNHTPNWVRMSRPKIPPLQFKDDADWLAHTSFAVNKDGSFNRRKTHCESTPTWPNNPELRKP